jgi:hypothetical protein
MLLIVLRVTQTWYVNTATLPAQAHSLQMTLTSIAVGSLETEYGPWQHSIPLIIFI